ncbi:uncharacterized protein VTP21DRAFT_6129 [Calcarisporiella thermophila]|uniref:uncharacterized protein n=1 Tax=Calcarisporiella thermophila TaxID=911321 RepID=UPI0037435082
MDSVQNQNSTLNSPHDIIHAAQTQYNWIHIASIVCALVMMGMVLYLRCKQPDVANTIALKLTLWIGLVDILSRIVFLIRVNPSVLNSIVSSMPWAPHLLVYMKYFSTMWFVFLNAAIAFDLHLSFLCRRNNIKFIQRLYCPLTMLASLLLSSPFVVITNIQWNVETQTITVSIDPIIALSLEILCFDLWVLSSILYSVAIMLAVAIHVFISLHFIQENIESMPVDMQDRGRQYTHSVLWILLYPMVLMVCCPADILLSWAFLLRLKTTPYTLMVLQAEAITTGLQGILNLLVFLLNPAVGRSLSPYRIFNTSGGSPPSPNLTGSQQA